MVSSQTMVSASPHKVARDVGEVAVMRLVGSIAILPVVALAQVLANTRDYSQPVAAIAVWLAVLGAAAWFVPRLRTRGLAPGETAAAIAIAVAAVAVIGAVHRTHGVPGSVDLAILGTIWLLVAVVLSRSALVWIPAALVVFTVHCVLLVRDAGLSRPTLSQLEAAGYIMAAVLLAFAALRPTLAIHASMAVRRASLASKSAAERAAAAAVQQERQSRLAVLEKEALPLLRGIADGTLDATADDVTERCAQHAAVLRHSLTGREPGAGELMTGLEPALRAARERGLLVAVQLIGDQGTPQARVAQAVRATVDAVLSALPPHQVTLTVLASDDDVELYLTFGAPLRSMPDLTRVAPDLPAAVRWHATLSAAETGGGFLEISWRKNGAA
jgi:hypothetical protein